MFNYKIHENSGARILAITDSDLIGKSFKHNGLEIEIKESFYGKESANEKEMIDIVRLFLKSESSINIVGNNAIDLLIKHEIITQDSVIDLSGTKHCQIYVIE